MVSSVGTTTTQTSAASTASTGLAENFDTFLLLLTTQLQNQDPLNPMDSSEFTSQLVQFTSVEQQIAANKNLEQLISLQSTTATTMALGYLGQEIEASGKTTALVDGKAIWQYDLEDAAEAVTLTVTNDAGKIVYVGSGEGEDGSNEFVWNGRDNDGTALEDGAYTLTVKATDADGKSVGVTTQIVGIVSSVSLDGAEPVLHVGDAVIALSDVTKIRQPTGS